MYRPLLGPITSIASSVRQMYGTLLGTRLSSMTGRKSTSSDTTPRNDHSGYKWMGGSQSDHIHLTEVSRGAGYKDFIKGNSAMRDDGITVRHDVEVV